jgi:hypothetical protein
MTHWPHPHPQPATWRRHFKHQHGGFDSLTNLQSIHANISIPPTTGGGFNPVSNSRMRPVWGFTHPWPKVDRGSHMNVEICLIAWPVFYKRNRRMNDDVTDKLFQE